MVWIVIPAHNEETSVPYVIHQLRLHGYHNIVVVDDGSRDNTFGVCQQAHVHVLRHVINRGQGAALRTGIAFALQQGAKIIVTFDADGQHDVNDIKRMVAPVEAGEVDVALGSRFLENSSDVPLVRSLFLKGGALLFRVLYGISLSDSHNGFRALSAHAARVIQIRSDGMAHASEIPEQIAKQGLRFREVPVTIHYTEYAKGHSHQGAFGAFKILWRMFINKLLR